MRKKIGSITPIWNQEMWILPHFSMLSDLDKNIVLLQKRPLPQYHIEHGYGTKPDLSEYLLRKYFPKVEIYESEYPEGKEFGVDLYNEGLKYVQDCDLVMRLDPDMFFTEKDWEWFLSFLQDTDFDCYRMDFINNSINYYMTGDFEHGLKDAKEYDPLVFDPKTPLLDVNGRLHYPNTARQCIITKPDWMCHHFRGWNKPKSTPNPAWGLRPESFELVERYGDSGEWYTVPSEVKFSVESSLKNLQKIKEGEK